MAARLGYVLHAQLLGGEETGRLDDEVDADLTPGQVRRIALGQDVHRLSVTGDLGVAGLDRAGVAAVHGVVLQEVRQRGSRCQVVDGDDLVAVALLDDAEDKPPDAAKTVDRYPDRHGFVDSELFVYR